MKKVWIMTAILVAGTSLAVTAKRFPNLKLSGLEKGELSRETIKGKVTIVNLWATWCEACKVELKEMEHVFSKLKSNENFSFAMVTLDKDPEKAVEWIKENLKRPSEALAQSYKDPEFSLAEKFSDDTFPVTLVVDQKGDVVKVYEGFEEGSNQTEEMANLVKKILAKAQ
ncbi:TlpA family protein disulfide reductase [Oligoflexaceae bacterium]|nr:TlpA family protein disulfide reductase [Oligoflexaceae bacterium]